MDYNINFENFDSTKKYWLNDAENLVTALTKVYGEITLTKISQQFEAPTSFEKKLLDNNEILIRKITLSSTNETLVFARTAIPQSTYDFFIKELSDLGTKPIGDNLLFDKKRFSRDAFIIRKLSKNDFEKEAYIDFKTLNNFNSDTIYSRSSIFTFKEISNLKMLITEYFLIIPETDSAK